MLLCLPAVCRKRTALVDGFLGSCATDVSAGQLLQLLEFPLSHQSSKQHRTPTAHGSSDSPATKQQQEQWRQLKVLHLDQHLAVAVKPFGLHVYGRGTGHLKHWLSQALPASSAGKIACRAADLGTTSSLH
jgi:23S rRNA-/tRNA-specific pseudouridylate synthase